MVPDPSAAPQKDAIGVVIPNYNGASYLDRCLDSVFDQTHSKLQVIVVDDASSDHSVDILRERARLESRLRFVVQPVNAGPAAARDRGFRELETPWVTTLDCDDILVDRTKLERELDVATRSQGSEPVTAFSGISRLNEQGQWLFDDPLPVREGRIFDRVLTRRCMVPRDYLMPRDLYFEVGGFDQSLRIYEDWDLVLRLSRECSFRYSGVTGVGYRRAPGGLSQVSPRRNLRAQLRVFERHVKHARSPRLARLHLLKSFVRDQRWIFRRWFE